MSEDDFLPDDDIFGADFEDEDFLPGIFNYCDRWCERCAFNSRCRNYRAEQRLNEKYPPDTLENSLEKVRIIFTEISKMLHRFAEEEGIDLTDIPESVIENEKRLERKVERHPLSEAGMEYAKNVSAWFKKNWNIIDEMANILHRQIALEDNFYNEPANELLKLHDVIEIILHYEGFIYVKISRALMDKFDKDFDDEFREEDMNLSAKLALIAIDRSVPAWKILSELLYDAEDPFIKEFINSLTEIRDEIENMFPGARKFVRPYFDDESESAGLN